MQCPNFNQIFRYCFNILEWLIFKICLEKYCLKDILDKSKNFLHMLYACGCYWRQSVLLQIAFSLWDKKNTQDQSRRAAVACKTINNFYSMAKNNYIALRRTRKIRYSSEKYW